MNEFEIAKSSYIWPDFELALAKWKVKWHEFIHFSNAVNVWTTSTTMIEYEIPTWKTWFVTYWKMSTWKGKEIFLEMQLSSNWVDFTTQHNLYCYQNNYNYRFSVPLKIEEWYTIRVQATAEQVNANTSASFDLILVDNKYL